MMQCVPHGAFVLDEPNFFAQVFQQKLNIFLGKET